MSKLVSSSMPGIAVAVTVALTSPAMTQEFSYVNNHANIKTMCGDKPARVALVDGFGGNSWRRIVLAELQDEAAKCKNITAVQYTDAAGDQQAYTSAINGYAAQGFDIIITYADFGDAALPAYRAATQAGVIMAPYNLKLSGTMDVDYSVNPYEDAFLEGRKFAEWVGTTIKRGNTVFLGGLPGSASSVVFLNGYKDGLKEFPDIELLDQNFIVTNWNPADAQRAVSGLIAKYPKIDAIVSDYGVTSLAAVKAYEQAGLNVPAMAFIATNNEYSCKYLDAKAQGKAWKQLALSGTTANVRFALRAAIAKLQGTENNEPRALVAFPFADSEKSIEPRCDKTLPPDADLSSSLSADKVATLFKN